MGQVLHRSAHYNRRGPLVLDRNTVIIRKRAAHAGTAQRFEDSKSYTWCSAACSGHRSRSKGLP